MQIRDAFSALNAQTDLKSVVRPVEKGAQADWNWGDPLNYYYQLFISTAAVLWIS